MFVNVGGSPEDLRIVESHGDVISVIFSQLVKSLPRDTVSVTREGVVRADGRCESNMFVDKLYMLFDANVRYVITAEPKGPLLSRKLPPNPSLVALLERMFGQH